MNNKERAKVLRIQSALGAIPGPSGGGTQSASLRGVLSYARDIKFVQDRLANALYLLRCPNQDYTHEEQEADFNETMQEIETFIEQRKQKDWQ